MQSGLRWSRSHSRRRFPVVGTPYAPPSARPCGCRGTVALVRRCALCGWSVACGQLCGVCPRPPLCFAAARHQPCALVCPSAPRGGSLSPRACLVGFATSFVAGHATNTGATGLAACKPAWPLAYFLGARVATFAITFIAACAHSTGVHGLFDHKVSFKTISKWQRSGHTFPPDRSVGRAIMDPQTINVKGLGREKICNFAVYSSFVLAARMRHGVG